MRKRRALISGGESSGHDGGGPLRWLLTYADMITLLMAFFIMMYSMSVLNVSRFRQVAVSIRSGFAGPLEGGGKSILSATGRFGVKPSPFDGNVAGVPVRVIQPLAQFIRKDKRFTKGARVYADKRGLVISLLSDALVFQAGRAEILPKGREILGRTASLLKRTPNAIRVEGHTCDLPPRGGLYPSNWELSTARATNVVRYLSEGCGVPAARMSAAGYAGVKPVVPNDSPEHRSMNRRVDIILVRLDETKEK